MKKFLLAVCLLFLSAFVFLYVARERLIRKGFESSVTKLTGFKTTVGRIRLELHPAVIHLQDLKIYNPQAFKKEIFADIPEIYIAPDLGPILRKESIHFREIRFAVKELNVVKDEKGVSNLQVLSSVGKSEGSKPQPQAAPQEKPALPFKLDRLELTLRKVSFEDHVAVLGLAKIPKKASVDLKIEKQIFKNITDPNAIVNVVLIKVLFGTTFGNLGIDSRLLKQDLAKTVSVGSDIILQTADEALKTTESVVQDTVGSATGILNQAAQTVGTVELGQATHKLTDKTETAVKETLGQAKQEVTGLLGKFKSKLNAQGDASKPAASDSESAR